MALEVPRGKGLPEDRNEIPIAFTTAGLDLRSVTMVLYEGIFLHLF